MAMAHSRCYCATPWTRTRSDGTNFLGKAPTVLFRNGVIYRRDPWICETPVVDREVCEMYRSSHSPCRWLVSCSATLSP